MDRVFFYPLNFVGSINMVTFAHVELLLPHRKKHAFWPATLRTAVHIRRRIPDKEIQITPPSARREKEEKLYISSIMKVSL